MSASRAVHRCFCSGRHGSEQMALVLVCFQPFASAVCSSTERGVSWCFCHGSGRWKEATASCKNSWSPQMHVTWVQKREFNTALVGSQLFSATATPKGRVDASGQQGVAWGSSHARWSLHFVRESLKPQVTFIRFIRSEGGARAFLCRSTRHGLAFCVTRLFGFMLVKLA